MNSILIIISLFFSLNIEKSPNEKKPKVDYLLKKSETYLSIDNLKSLRYAKQASLIAEKTGNSPKKAEAYLHIARCTQTLGTYKESLYYIEKALKEHAVKNDFILNAELKEIKATNYGMLHLYQQEIMEYQEIIAIIANKSDLKSQRLSARIYTKVASYYLEKKDYGNAKKTIKKSFNLYNKILKKIPIKTSEISDLYNIEGYIQLYDKVYDSAYFYFNKSYNQAKIGNDSKKMYIQHISFGDYYFHLQNFNKSIEYYEKAINDLQKYNIDDPNYQEVYKNISSAYSSLNDKQNSAKYLNKYYSNLEKIQNMNMINFQAAVNTILKGEFNQKEELKTQNWVANSFITLSLSTLLVFSYLKYKEIKKRKRIIICEKDNLLLIQKELIAAKDSYTKKLEEKLLVTPEEIMNLVKTNSPYFLDEFKKLNPNFHNILEHINPSLNNGELTLLAFIFLNLSSKEIALYTFRSYRTIQNRKYLLRKKLGLNKEDDLYIWLKKQVKN
ncbi:tetratricopeptide repeat protein [Chryseobacterium sp. 7]|uniref:transcriptional regulator n=1 Tax=Chryseobacterium sp. 7 TaxID=2035214 RepID=UPI000EB1663A|nr:hypothetical protein [Chryseobacterium sp. 7]RLJ30685.1 tetratricopeptide repeat protein [Chryseobacterium sp. 7]